LTLFGTVIVCSTVVLKQVRGNTEMETLGVGIVGFGDGGQCNFRALSNIPGAHIAAVCDLDSDTLQKTLIDMGAPPLHYWNSAKILIADSAVDLVVVATPDDKHLEIAQAALEAGKYVFVEKPVATTIADLFEFKKLAIQYPGKLLFGEKYSSAPPIAAASAHENDLGEFLTGATFYNMWKCDRIMGGGKWRTQTRYNPCAGGLSHNFMTTRLFAKTSIVRVSARGQVLTYHENLDETGGFDTMQGLLEFADGRVLTWKVCLAIENEGSLYAHRTIAHHFQFRNGALIYGPSADDDRVIFARNGKRYSVNFSSEPHADGWAEYNLHLYTRMHMNLLDSIHGKGPQRHSIEQGINVAAACALAFESAQQSGEWLEIPQELR